MYLGYNTNGLAHHSPTAAFELLAELGYEGVALTLDWNLLNPFSAGLADEIAATRRQLRRLGLRSAVETGARYLLDPRTKHEPTLVSADAGDRVRRGEFLCRAIDIAAELGSECVSLWSGVLHDGAPAEVAWQRLAQGLGPVLEHAARRGVRVGFEPEPGMFVDTLARFGELDARLSDPRLELTLDVGHVHCQQEGDWAPLLRAWGARLVHVHLEDMRRGVHEHLQFGEGEIDFPAVLTALRQCGYAGGLYVELSRHSHAAPVAAAYARQFLQPLLAGC